MADTPNSGETVVTGQVSNDATTTPTTPVTDNGGNAELEQFKKQLEQERMRNNQLSNQLADKQRADEVARQKQLEEKEEFKTLYEQTNAKLNEMQDNLSANERRQELIAKTDEVFKDYPASVVELARTAGLSLNDDSDTAATSLKEKLDAFKAKITPGGSVTSNNPHQPAPVPVNREELTKRNAEGYSPMAMASAKGDNTPIRQYIHELPAIKRMKELATQGA